MKTRESGMPDETMWESFFDPPAIFDKLGLGHSVNEVAEFGCGYGTFTLAAARRVKGKVYAFDIEAEMVSLVLKRAHQNEIRNIVCEVRDFMTQGTGLADSTVDYVMLFNILHAEQPDVLLSEAWRVLRPGGRLGIIHWNHDPLTPRGPSMKIRPRPDQCCDWARSSGFGLSSAGIINLPPYHYGMMMERL